MASPVTMTLMADGNISKYSVVCIGRFDNTVRQTMWPDVVYMSSILGVALNDAGDGGNVDICSLGTITDPTWTWERGKPIYVTVGGYLTQTIPPKSIYKIGKAVASNVVFVSLSEYLMLE